MRREEDRGRGQTHACSKNGVYTKETCICEKRPIYLKRELCMCLCNRDQPKEQIWVSFQKYGSLFICVGLLFTSVRGQGESGHASPKRNT